MTQTQSFIVQTQKDIAFLASQNDGHAWLMALGVMGGVFFGFVWIRIIAWAVAKRLERVPATTLVGTFIRELLRSLSWLVPLLVSVYAGSLFLELPRVLANKIHLMPLFATLLQLGLWSKTLMHFFIQQHIDSQEPSRQQILRTMLGPFEWIGVFLTWSLLMLFALDNLGFNPLTLVAGLGIGGVAVALAVQKILGDLLAAFSIVMDRPFVVGDTISVDSLTGTVEHIGLKATRIRSINGELLIFSNSDLLASRIRNYGAMTERRVLLSFWVGYHTPKETLSRIPEMVKVCIEAQQPVRFDRAHFKGFEPYGLAFEAVYFILSPDYNLFMDVQQAVNLSLYETLDKENIPLAKPDTYAMTPPSS